MRSLNEGVSAADRLPSSGNAPKKRTRRVRLPGKLGRKGMLIGAGLCFVGVILTTAWVSGTLQRTLNTAKERFVAASVEAGFQVRDVTVSGRGETPAQDIIAALDTRRGAPILSVDLSEARQRIEALPSVHSASVERILPDTLHVIIEERQAAAVWQNEGRHVLMDRKGHLLPGNALGRSDLLLVVGKGAAEQTDALMTLLGTQPALALRVKAAVRVSERRWNVMLDEINGLEIRLPEEKPEEAWQRLAQLEQEKRFGNRKLEMVDMRLREPLVLREKKAGGA